MSDTHAVEPLAPPAAPVSQSVVRPAPPFVSVAPHSGFDVTSWYWIVGNVAGQVYSSAAGNYVSDTDTGYQNWVAGGGVAINIATDGELADVLTNYAGSGQATAMAIRAAGWTDWGGVPVPNQFAVMVAAGCPVVSTSEPSLNGTYAMDDNARVRQNSNVNYIQNNNAFAPNEAATKDWPDVTGAMHTFTSTRDFLNWVTATGNWYSALADWAAAGGVGTLPTEPVTMP